MHGASITFIPPPPCTARHGTALFLGSEKRCIHDGRITGNKQTSERAMHSASWISMNIGVGVLNGSFVDAFESEPERTKCSYMIVWPLQLPKG